jgi:protein-L-isoaspartate O-methyltransferase
MTGRPADRFVWAVQTLDVAPSERLLEIGCGQGVAVALICESLSSGSITAIDRSKPMIDQAVRRNREHVESGRATFHAVSLAEAAVIRNRFDKAFVINVRLFRTDAAQEARVLKGLLKPRGAFYLFQQHPSAKRTRAVTEELAIALEDQGFGVEDVKARGGGDALMTCIVAAPSVTRASARPR